MDPRLHFLALQMPRTLDDSPEAARRREILRDREVRSRRAHRWRLILLTLAALGILASATAAEAGVVRNTTVSYAYAGWVPCADGGAGELVTGTIDAHLLDTSTVNDGVETSQFMFAPRGTLVGARSGDAYRLTGVERGTYVTVVQGDRFVLTYVNRYHLIGPGSGNNLVVRETAHITSNGDDVIVAFDDYTLECG